VIRTPANNRIASVVLDLLVSREVDLLSAVLPAKPVAVSRRISKIVTRRSDPHTNEVITCRHTAEIEATSDETERSTAEWSTALTNERCVPYKPNRNVCSFDFHHRHANGSEQNEVTPLCDELHSSAVGHVTGRGINPAVLHRNASARCQAPSARVRNLTQVCAFFSEVLDARNVFNPNARSFCDNTGHQSDRTIGHCDTMSAPPRFQHIHQYSTNARSNIRKNKARRDEDGAPHQLP
jgi:hypothetical protein